MISDIMSRRRFVRLAAATVACSGIRAGADEPMHDGRTSMKSEPAAPGEAHSIGHHKHLFIDDWLTSESINVELRVNPPERKGLVLCADKPWERGGITSYCNVLWDEAH